MPGDLGTSEPRGRIGRPLWREAARLGLPRKIGAGHGGYCEYNTMKKRLTIGIDEVGRGALAGPVVLSAVVRRGHVRWFQPELGRIRDSKKLTSNGRLAWFRYLTAHPGISWGISPVSPGVIDRISIARAANLAARRLVRRLAPLEAGHQRRLPRLRRGPLTGRARQGSESFIWLDGGLVLPSHIPHRTLVKGDERKPIIAAASIIAKVWRDRLMVRLAAKIPGYGFEFHKGYGTRVHRRMIRRHGPSEIHRRTFITKII